MRTTYKDLGIDTDKPWTYAQGHYNHNGHRQTGKWKCGPGGMDCPCCSKLPPNKLKVKFNRWMRRKAKQMISSLD
jgi:hypothetical protein